MTASTYIETDDRSRVVLPGHKNQRFLLQEREDGSLLLQPAVVLTTEEAQRLYDNDPELREMLKKAMQSPGGPGPRNGPRRRRT